MPLPAARAVPLALLLATAALAQTPPLPLLPRVTIVFWVRELPRSQQFFAQVLGARTLFADPEAGFAELTLPGSEVSIGLARGERPAGNRVVPTFHVADLDAAARTLQALQVQPLGPVQEMAGLCRLLRIADPDGTEFQLVQPLQQQPSPFANVAFLVGHWRSERGGTAQEEVWSAPAGAAMAGQNRSTRGDELVDFELLRIVRRGDELFYEARPRGGRAVLFRLVAAEPGRVVFANPEHDFPRRISYWLQDGELCAAVDDGKDDGKRLAFRWKRVP